MQAVIIQAIVAAINAFMPSLAISAVLLGARAEIPPTKIAMDAKCAKPQRA